ncbi:HlyD family secretion protein [Endozoicomonas sp. SCSIO W0465]|uniref:HlyD family secretion protein n=1 Tax=Endozoicomonas sp. SCSIO W0465 TaxID=2918516 RepID=UPI002074E13C|nr:HlyD family secretion protein [Endozoicomonas sp. SCSIO W0465]USE37150.1 HlyD family secretion protein [Endozoicomonas sp. SCSIO W0465]
MTILAFAKIRLRPILLTATIVAIGAFCTYYLWLSLAISGYLWLSLAISGYLWQQYLAAPWTRDGRLRAEIAEIAQQVSGNIIRIAVPDNGLVKKGDVILEIDPSNYRIAPARSESELAAARFKQEQLASTARRLDGMPEHMVSAEQVTNARLAWKAQQQAVKTAEAALSQAQLDLKRTRVRAPFDGFVANMDLRVGSWLTAGQSVLAFINRDHYFVVGYFQETRLQGVCPGAPATITCAGRADSTFHQLIF